MGKYPLGYGPKQKADMVKSVLSQSIILKTEFSNSGDVKLGRSWCCICANLRLFWDAFKMGRILQKWHISNTNLVAEQEATSPPARRRDPPSSEDSVAQLFSDCKITHFWKELICYLELKERHQTKNNILSRVLAVKILCWNAKG